MLFGPKDSPYTEVFFGWIANTSKDVDIFHSQDAHLVGMFIDYFESLKTVPNRVTRLSIDYRDPASDPMDQSPIRRVVGCWISISGDNLKDPDVDPRASDKHKLKNYSIITIYHDSSGWSVDGQTFDLQSHAEENSFKSSSCQLVDSIMYYTYARCDEFGKAQDTGIGLLRFKPNGATFMGNYSSEKTRMFNLIRGEKCDLGRLTDLDYRREVIRRLTRMKI